MCGIAGFVGSSSRETLERMLSAIEHRGPDDKGVLIERNVGLGHRRLAIIDTSARGHQPMTLEREQIAIVLNGEIYNFKELRVELEGLGIVFQSDSDTEVLLHLYAVHGENFLEKTIGMFAIALYDFKRDILFLARDRMGEKPLYWHLNNDTLHFASELRGLMAAGIKKEVDMTSLAQYLQFDYVPTPRTMLQNVFKLEPATLLKFQQGTVIKRQYWKPQSKSRIISAGDARRELDTRLQESVARQLIADVPLGVFLSGGLDSSTVAHYAARASSSKIHTFSIGFDDPSFDESKFAREMAGHIGTEHHELTMRENDALSLVSEIPEVFSEPVADASVIPTLFLSRFARQSVTVALGGDGGDELFAGYPTFQADVAHAAYRHLPRMARRGLLHAARLLPVSHENFHWTYNVRKFLSSDSSNSARRHLEWLGTFSEREKEVLLIDDKHSPGVFERAESYGEELDGSTENKLLYTYMRTYLMDQVLVKVDRASMHYALETRAPFLDHTIVDFVLSLPFSLKYHRGTTKYLLKQLMNEKLPAHLVGRKKKGFGIPLAKWLTGPLRPLCEELLSPQALEKHGLFNARHVTYLKDSHMNRVADNRKELWNLMVFQMWFRRWMG